jgi:uncharacterized membrane protein
MDQSLASLVAANVTFVGSHFVLSHPLRAPLVRMLGEKGFAGLYSLIGLASFAWVAMAFRAVGPGAPLYDHGNIGWAIASVLTLVAMVLLLGSFRGNPALPQAGSAMVANAKAQGAFAVTRHPMMWGFGLWALAHMLAWPSPRTLVTAGAMGLLALVGSHLQDRKKAALMGDAWRQWEARTSYWPRFGGLTQIGLPLWLLAIAVWLAATWWHSHAGVVPAGLWRWIG